MQISLENANHDPGTKCPGDVVGPPHGYAVNYEPRPQFGAKQATVGVNAHSVRRLFHFLSSVSPLSSAWLVISAVRQAGKVSHSCRPRANAAYATVRQAARLPALFAARP